MKSNDCSERCCAITQFGLNADFPRPVQSRRHDMLYVTYLRTCDGSTREDLCQILIKDIREALSLQARPLAADLLVVLTMLENDCGRAPSEEIVGYQSPRVAGMISGDKAA
jgi:hypothetical protein